VSGLLIAGAGGHGRVVADAAQANGSWSRIAFLDDRFPGSGKAGAWQVVGRLGDADSLLDRYSAIVVALGDNEKRLRWIDHYRKQGFDLPIVIHPRAVVSAYSDIGEGSVILSQAVVNTGARLGVGCIVNTSAIIEHDCRVSDGVHISPGACLAGNVSVGRCSWVGIGASIRQGIVIGEAVMVGAGAAVVSDLPSGITAIGVPAKAVESGS